MRAIFGIGNPGIKYKETRHNIGFEVVDLTAKYVNAEFNIENKLFLGARCLHNGAYFILIKPLTYVNLSGKAFLEAKNIFDLKDSDILVVTDDINLNLGELRLRKNGGDGGHNGIYSIINSINSVDFPRLRIGIGANFEKGKMADYVLSKFNEEEKEVMHRSLIIASEIALNFVFGGIEQALNYYSKVKSEIRNRG